MQLLNCFLIGEHVQSAKVNFEYVSLKIASLLIELVDHFYEAGEPIISLNNVHEEIFINQYGGGVALL